MLDVLNADYIRLARAKGLPRPQGSRQARAAVTRLIPVVTVGVDRLRSRVRVGPSSPNSSSAGKGWATTSSTAVNNIDVNVVLAWLMVTAGWIVIVFNLIADLLYGVLDRGIRYA